MHAYQSLVWNRAATARAQLGLDLLEGDLVLPQGAETETGKPKGEDAEQARLVTAADLAAGELSFDDVVLPLPGFAMTYPKVEAVGAVYEAALRADGIDLGDDSTSRGGPLVALPGSYRRLRQRVPDLECERIRYTGDDEQLLVTDYDAAIGRTDATTAADATAPHTAVRLTFTMPRSCYATMLIRELTKVDSSSHAHRERTQAMHREREAAAAGAPLAGANAVPVGVRAAAP